MSTLDFLLAPRLPKTSSCTRRSRRGAEFGVQDLEDRDAGELVSRLGPAANFR
ncbi:hypothetical protein [Rubrobacter aplysinae]|uniref:hypothetical protein n=1 Tax=Rubrobacter aplysinae TaxID=909625 RepID=UPI001364A07B|nr:hypothetical protein [Rubrobacter aplysinae]